MALTILQTVTFFWVLSDFLSAKANSLKITGDLMKGSEADLEAKAAEHNGDGSDAALWMLLLLRLAALTSDERLDLRNSAIQTLLRIFDAYGGRLSPEAWSLCIKSVVFKLITSLEEELEAANDENNHEKDRVEWHGTAVVVLDGIAGLLANHVEVLTAHASFNTLWRELLGHFETLLDFQVLEMNHAAFNALAHILSQANSERRAVFDKPTVDFAWDLWARGIPISKPIGEKSDDNQNCLVSYVAALGEIYKLIETDLSVERVQRILTLLQKTVQEASTSGYVSDVENPTQLQNKVLAAVQMIRTDVHGVPAAVVAQLSIFISLAYTDRDSAEPNPKRTYVAMSKASMKVVEALILNHTPDTTLYERGSFSNALKALYRPIALKYDFTVSVKSEAPWRLATTSVLSILAAALPQLDSLKLSRQTVEQIWIDVAAVADGILSASCIKAPTGPAFVNDEAFDISAFSSLRQLIVPSLGAETVPDQARKAYASSLFKTSVLHPFTHAERYFGTKEDELGLATLYTPRPGRTKAVPATHRKEMAYVAFQELFALVSAGGESNDDKSRGDSAAYDRIASTTAPLLILRCALTIRAYAADQPLRGQMPQPLSQRKELTWTLERLVALESRGKAIPSLKKAGGDTRKHLLRLYPLLVTALSVRGEEKVERLLRDALETVGGELGITSG